MLYRWHNGEDGKERKPSVHPPWCGDWQPLDQVVADCQLLKNIFYEKDHYFDDLPSEFGGREHWWNIGWIPFISWGTGDLTCVDTIGLFGGKPRQIITFIHDDAYRIIEYPNLFCWLSTALRGSQDPSLRDGEGNIDLTGLVGDPIWEQLNPGYPVYFPPID